MATREKLYILRDLMELPEEDSNTRYELSSGKIIPLQPNPLDHGFVCGQLFVPLYQLVEAANLGMAGIGGAFLLHHNPATDQAVLRYADVAFIRAERLINVSDDDIIPGAPDLVAEVIAPKDTAYYIEAKLYDYLHYGSKLVWLIYPETRRITVYTSNNEFFLLKDSDILTAVGVLPGFSISIRELFAVLDSPPDQSS